MSDFVQAEMNYLRAIQDIFKGGNIGEFQGAERENITALSRVTTAITTNCSSKKDVTPVDKIDGFYRQ